MLGSKSKGLRRLKDVDTLRCVLKDLRQRLPSYSNVLPACFIMLPLPLRAFLASALNLKAGLLRLRCNRCTVGGTEVNNLAFLFRRKSLRFSLCVSSCEWFRT